LIGSAKIWERGGGISFAAALVQDRSAEPRRDLEGLSRMNRELLAKVEAVELRQRVVLDMDNTDIPVYGEQEQSAYNWGSS
jgi:hypothetical protein